MRDRCPSCGRAILSRRSPLCGFYRQPLPAELLFNAAEIAAIEADERERAEASLAREEARAEEAARQKEVARRNASGGGGWIGSFGC